MIVKPKDDATPLKVDAVVEPDGTYTVLDVPLLYEQKELADVTFGEAMRRVNPFNDVQPVKQDSNVVADSLYLNKSSGMELSSGQLAKTPVNDLPYALYLNRFSGMDVMLLLLKQ